MSTGDRGLGTLPGAHEFAWRDGERMVRFAAGSLVDVVALLERHGWRRFELLTTRRALNGAPLELPRRALAAHEVAPGPVAEASAPIVDKVITPTLVALGGGRVIDTAKAVAAVRGGRVAAIPTTLSGAEMTRLHRLPEGREAPHLVRPGLVLADPLLMTGLDDGPLRASAMNSLAHGAEALYGPGANPVASIAALRGAGLIAGALGRGKEVRARGSLALGSLLCAYALDSAGFAVHHVVCQTLVAKLGLPHAETNAAMLPRTMELMHGRAPEAIAALGAAIGAEPGEVGARIAILAGGPRRLAELGGERERLGAALDAILAREQLAATPDPPGRDELAALLEEAW